MSSDVSLARAEEAIAKLEKKVKGRQKMSGVEFADDILVMTKAVRDAVLAVRDEVRMLRN